MNNQLQFVRHQSTKAQRRTINNISAPDELVQLTPQQFEACCAYLYEAEGYRVSRNVQENSEIDLLLELGHERVIVQCRRFVGKVTEVEVQNLYKNITKAEANAAVLISTGPISMAAKTAAKDKPITLIAGSEVYDWLRYTQAVNKSNGRGGVFGSNLGKFALAFVLLSSLVVVAGAAAIAYVVYSQNAQTTPVMMSEETVAVSAELQPTIVVLRQTPPKPTSTAIITQMLVAAEPTAEPTVDPLPTEVSSANIAIKRFETPPPLDTNLDNWPSLPAFTTSYRTENSAEITSTLDTTSIWRLGWDSGNLYGIVVVEDDIHVQTQPAQFAYSGDSIELAIDGNNDRATLARPDDFQYVISPGNFFNYEPDVFRFRGGQNGLMGTFIGTQGSTVATQTPTGYTIAFRIPWFDMGIRSPAVGTVLGVSLSLNDNDTPATALQEVQYSHTPGSQWGMPITWGTLTLGD